MLAQSFSISPLKLWTMMATPRGAQTRRRAAARHLRDPSPACCPASHLARSRPCWRTGSGTLDRTRPVVIACKAGKELSQNITAELRAAGYDAAMLAGRPGARGLDAKLPTIDRKTGRPPRCPSARAPGSRGGGRRSTGSPARG